MIYAINEVQKYLPLAIISSTSTKALNINVDTLMALVYEADKNSLLI
jgi:hypothetical protein